VLVVLEVNNVFVPLPPLVVAEPTKLVVPPFLAVPKSALLSFDKLISKYFLRETAQNIR
jgi:hypothetical protein